MHFLFNWGVETSRKLPDKSKCVIAFYTWDYSFDDWWWEPAKFVGKVKNSGINLIVSPNFSQYPNQHKAMSLYNHYRSRYLARYFQEADLKVIPDIEWPQLDSDYQRDYVLNTLPKNMPLISLQMHNHKPKWFAEHEKELIKEFQAVFDVLEPQGLLFYAGNPGREWFFEHITPRCDVKFVTSRMQRIADVQRKDKRKHGKDQVPKKESATI
jgi:hypothetical protein